MKINSLIKLTAMNKMTPAVRILLVVNVALFLLDRLIPYKMTEMLGLYLPVNEKFAVWPLYGRALRPFRGALTGFLVMLYWRYRLIPS